MKNDASGYRSGWPGPYRFFTSLAFSYGYHALVIVLAGTGTSGAVGVQEVKHRADGPGRGRGHFLLLGGMPQPVIKTGRVDLVLPLPQDRPGPGEHGAQQEHDSH